MKEGWRGFLLQCEAEVCRILAFLRKLFEPAIFVGNRDRARKPDEEDTDAARLGEFDRNWRQMLKDDPWMQKLMMHVRLLLQVSLVFFAIFLICGLVLSAKHPILPYIMGGLAATIPYWIWIGKWNKKIEIKVFEAFKKRFGKHFHLR
jgi:hypothetical protein